MLCYIVFKADLMKEPSVYLIFRLAFIIRSLFMIRVNESYLNWFEQLNGDTNESTYEMKV